MSNVGHRQGAFGAARARSMMLGSKGRLALYRRCSRSAARGYDTKVTLEVMLKRARVSRPVTVPLIEGWLRQINNGQTFSSVLGNAVPAAERMAISSGEETGNLEEGFAMAAFIVESGKKLRGGLIAGLAYPVLLFALLAVMLYFIAYLLIPMMEGILAFEYWPPLSASLWYVAKAVKTFGPGALAVGLVAGFVVIATLPRWTGKLRSKLDRRVPPWSIYREIQSGLLLVTLAGAVKSGTPVDEAIRRMKRSGSPWLNLHLESAMRAIAEGRRPAEALDTGLMSADLMDDLTAYDSAGDLSESILMLGRDCIELIIEKIRFICVGIGVALMLLVGGALIWTWASFLMMFIEMRANQQLM